MSEKILWRRNIDHRMMSNGAMSSLLLAGASVATIADFPTLAVFAVVLLIHLVAAAAMVAEAAAASENFGAAGRPSHLPVLTELAAQWCLALMCVL